MRIGEVLGLHLGDVDVQSCEIRVERNLAPPRRRLTLEQRVDTPKSGQTRVLEIGKELADVLERHLVRRRAENLKQGKDDASCPWLFATEVGTPLDERPGIRTAATGHQEGAGRGLTDRPGSRLVG